MGLAVDLGTGTTIAFGTSSFSVEITDVNIDGIERANVDTSHMGTAAATAGNQGNRTFLPGDLVNPGQINFTGHFNPDSDPPIGAAAETITVTYPKGAGESTASDWEGSGFLVSMSVAVPLDDKMVANFTVQFTGNVALTDAA